MQEQAETQATSQWTDAGTSRKLQFRRCTAARNTATSWLSFPEHCSFLYCPSRLRLPRSSCLPGRLLGVHQIYEWKNEHPDKVHEMPVKADRLNVAGIQACPAVFDGHYGNGDDTGDDVH